MFKPMRNRHTAPITWNPRQKFHPIAYISVVSMSPDGAKQFVTDPQGPLGVPEGLIRLIEDAGPADEKQYKPGARVYHVYLRKRPKETGGLYRVKEDDSPELVFTPEQMARAKSNKAVGYIWMRAIDFLRLTTPSDAYIFAIMPYEKGKSPPSGHAGAAKPLEFYNDLSLKGEITVAPFLQVAIESGEVIGHEGRHRAAALYQRDPEAKMRVSIELIEGWSRHWSVIYYRELDTPPWTKTFLSIKDIPKVLTTQQFRSGIYADWGARLAEIRIDLKDAQNYWYGQKRTWD